MIVNVWIGDNKNPLVFVNVEDVYTYDTPDPNSGVYVSIKYKPGALRPYANVMQKPRKVQVLEE
jgi:hypothetical protein